MHMKSPRGVCVYVSVKLWTVNWFQQNLVQTLSPQSKPFLMSNSNMAEGGIFELGERLKMFCLGEGPHRPPTQKPRQNTGKIVQERSY